MELANLVLSGPHTVIRSHPLQVSFLLEPDLVTRECVARQVSPAAILGQPMIIPGLGLVKKPGLDFRTPKVVKGEGPHLFMTFQADQPVLRFDSTIARTTSQTARLKLDEEKFEESSQRSREKKISRWRERRIKAHFVELKRPDGSVIAVATLEQPVVACFPATASSDLWMTAELEAAPDDKLFEGFISCLWYPDRPEGVQVNVRRLSRVYQVKDYLRFPRAPAIELNLDTMRNLKAGDQVGKWLDEDPPLSLGYDRQLADARFAAVGSEGHNCVTDYGNRYSIPLRCPTAQEWDETPLPIPLNLIRGLRDTPPHSWHDEVMSFVGKRLKGMELGPRNGCAESVPTARLRKRLDVRGELPPQPCYDGPHLWQMRIGRYKIFAVQLLQGVVYLTDSNWRDKETAILFFATLEDAKNYCRGKRPSTPAWFGKRDHDHEGNWKTDLVDRISAALTNRYITLSTTAANVDGVAEDSADSERPSPHSIEGVPGTVPATRSSDSLCP